MRLLFIAPASSIHTRRWVNYFRNLGNKICLVSFYPADGYEGVEFHNLECPNKNLTFMRFLRVKKIIDNFKPDLVHAHFATSSGLVAALAGFHPYILSVWGSDLTRFPTRSPAHRGLIRYVLSRADYVTATSHYLADKVRQYSDKEPLRIPFGVDDRFFRVARVKRGTEFNIGIIKSVEKIYGFETLVKAFKLIADDHSNVRLHIVGSGSYISALQAKCEAMGISEHVNFPGYIDYDKIIDIYEKLDLFVLPSYHEAFGVAAAEASAAGLPVVASNVEGLPEVIEDGKTGILIKPGDVKALKKAIEFYMENPDERIEHGNAGRLKAEAEYRWVNNAGLMNNLYQKILKEL